MHTRAMIFLLLIPIGLFFWERDFAVNSVHVQAQITQVRDMPDSRARRVYFTYQDPQTGAPAEGTMKSPPLHTFLGINFHPGAAADLRRSSADPSEFKPGGWFGLYSLTTYASIFVLCAVIAIGVGSARGSTD